VLVVLLWRRNKVCLDVCNCCSIVAVTVVAAAVLVGVRNLKRYINNGNKQF
jgi:hypothetical protein